MDSRADASSQSHNNLNQPVDDISAHTLDGNDAVCFTAGIKGAVFGAGTIHAYLAARRKCPKVVAGISMGALNAAAMQRSYRELNNAAAQNSYDGNTPRWAWFRKYVDALSEEPLNAMWSALPSQSDFFADMNPIHDSSVPPILHAEENEARRRLYLLVKLGHWLADLPLRVSLISGAIVNYIRCQEKYPFVQRVRSFFLLVWQLVRLLLIMLSHCCLSPHFFPIHMFQIDKNKPLTHTMPFFKSVVPWLNLLTVTLMLIYIPLMGIVIVFYNWPHTWKDAYVQIRVPLGFTLLIVLITILTSPVRKWIMNRSVVDKYVFPIARFYIKTLGAFNIFFWSAGIILSARILYLYALGGDSDGWLPVLVIDLFGMAIICVLFTPAVLLPEIRRWMVAEGLLQQWPRPLLGWHSFIFLWIHLLSLFTFISLGFYFLLRAFSAEGLRSYIRFLLDVWRWFEIPFLPLILIAIPIIFWNKVRSYAGARHGLIRVGGWILSILMLGALLVAGMYLCDRKLNFFWQLLNKDFSLGHYERLWILFCISAFCLVLTWLLLLAIPFLPMLQEWVLSKLCVKVGLGESIAYNFYLRIKLLKIFDAQWLEDQKGKKLANDKASEDDRLTEAILQNDPMPAIIVAAPLQSLYKGNDLYADQLWAKNGTPLVRALCAALALPPLLAPIRLETEEELKWWLPDFLLNNKKNIPQLKLGLDLVDGSVIRQNPIPALFSFLRGTDIANQMALKNNVRFRGIHVVHGVPIEERSRKTHKQEKKFENGEEPIVSNNIVDVGLTSLRLAARRDTQLEVMQTNFISRIETCIPASSKDDSMHTNHLFADEIAPTSEITFKNPFSPQKQEILNGIREGCRHTLETLYRHDIAKYSAPGMSIKCTRLLASIKKLPSTVRMGAKPGLQEICEGCCGTLNAPSRGWDKKITTASVGKTVEGTDDLVKLHPQLSGGKPRIAFVASGGVFRGSFHIGMIAALKTCEIKPDLIIGASVGTLMGGVLGAAFCTDNDVIGKLVHCFLHVDDDVALTHTLKSAARQIGMRSRSIRLSPRAVQKMVRRGSRSDPGYAAAGAPTPLIDAIADLFMIPYHATSLIAAKVVAGKVTKAVYDFLQQLQKETIRRLQIEKAIIGTSLLDQVMVDLLTDSNHASRLQRQPFQHKGIAFFGMTTDLNTHSAVLLGTDGLHSKEAYDFVEASLASSAFPAVFAPRAESQIFPGIGRTDVFFADGGMFDNLPFLPAIEILSCAQKGYRETAGRNMTALQFLSDRLEKPDLIIAGALDPMPEPDINKFASFKTLFSISSRVKSIQKNNKLRAFEFASRRVYSQLQRYRQTPPPEAYSTDLSFVDKAVNAAVLPVIPASREHLNKTFAFCASMGLKKTRVQKSIGDGCFQTLDALAYEQQRASKSASSLDHDTSFLTAKSVSALTQIPSLKSIPRFWVRKGDCPYFQMTNQNLRCPFARKKTQRKKDPYFHEMYGVYRQCKRDRDHRPRLYQIGSNGHSNNKIASKRDAYLKNKTSVSQKHSAQIHSPSLQLNLTQKDTCKNNDKEDDVTGEQIHRVYHRLGLHLPLSILLLIAMAVVGLGVVGPEFERSTRWLFIFVLMAAFAVVIGHGITGYWRGILIDNRFKMSLSRLQLLAWTLLILSALFTAVLTNIGLTEDPMEIEIPSELWVLLGISTASAVGAPAILSTKRNREADREEADKNVSSIVNSEKKDAKDMDARSIIIENKTFEAARWSELVKGDESGNAASVDIGKLQMLFFTFILVIGYGAAIAALFTAEGAISCLPAVGGGMSTLLGISHTGYLSSKAITHSKEASDKKDNV